MKKLAKLHWFALFTLAFTPRSCIAFVPSESRIRLGFITRPFPRSNLFEIPDGSDKRFEILDCSSENDGLSAFEQKASKQKITSDLTLQKILSFAIPAVGIWLCNPLLSIIDTSSVGLIAGTVQQAALNPAVAVTDYSALCMSFLYIGTTNLIAVANENDSNDPERSSIKHTLLGALRLSLRVGVGLCIVLLAFATPMLRWLLGNNAMSQEVMAAAQKYVWIRSLGMPAAAMIGSAQAACLGMQDVKSPLLVTLLAASVNLMADIILIRQANPWIGGTAGAAWATIMSQYVAVICYLQWLCRGSIVGSQMWKVIREKLMSIRKKLRPVNSRLGEVKVSSVKYDNQTNVGGRMDESLERLYQTNKNSAKGILRGQFRLRDLFFRPHGEKSISQKYSPYVVPVTITSVGRCSVYVAMGRVVSSLSVVNMAANQILNSFFYALIPIADALSQTAQALLPPIFNSLDSEERPKEKIRLLRSALQSFLRAAVLCGGILAGLVACIPWLTKTWMTSDPAVQQIVNSVIPIHILIFTLHGIFCASEGILLAQKDLGYLSRMYGLYFAVVPTIMLQLTRFGTQLELQSIWSVFLAYQLFRISAWVGRVFWLFRKQKVAIEGKEVESYVPLLVPEK